MEVQEEFDIFVTEHLKGKELPEVTEIQKEMDSSKQHMFRNDGHELMSDIDIYLSEDPAGTDEQEISAKSYRNIWDMLEDNFIVREDVASFELVYDNKNHIVKKLDVILTNGSEALFRDTKLDVKKGRV